MEQLVALAKSGAPTVEKVFVVIRGAFFMPTHIIRELHSLCICSANIYCHLRLSEDIGTTRLGEEAASAAVVCCTWVAYT